MARFDPNTYPDRLEFEANARRMQQAEIVRVFGAALAWLKARHDQLTSRVGRLVTAAPALSPRHARH
jgi:hypothetical protein